LGGVVVGLVVFAACDFVIVVCGLPPLAAGGLALAPTGATLSENTMKLAETVRTVISIPPRKNGASHMPSQAFAHPLYSSNLRRSKKCRPGSFRQIWCDLNDYEFRRRRRR
jgi:hypothetical protein